MDEGTPNSRSSPSFPSRRIGLSRKRKLSSFSSPSQSLVTEPSELSLNTPVTTINLEKQGARLHTPSKSKLKEEERGKKTPLLKKRHIDLCDSVVCSPQSNRIEYLHQLECKLAAFSDHSVLEKDVAMWRGACKDALLELNELVNSSSETKMSCREMSTKLGIYSVIKQQFANDSEIIDPDDIDDDSYCND